MVTIDQAMRGVAQYADNEIIPHLPTGKALAPESRWRSSWTAAKAASSR